MDLLVEVREVVFERPLLNLPLVAIRVSVIVVAIPIALVEPLLVLALELVVEKHTLDMDVALGEPFCHAQVGLIDLRVMFELALAFEACVELLARVVVAIAVRVKNVAAALRQDHRHVRVAVQPDGVDETLLTQVAEVPVTGIGGPVEVVAQVAGGHDPKRANGRERPGLRPTQRVFTVAGIVNDFSFASARQIEAPHEHIAGINLAVPRLAIAVRPPLVIAVTRVVRLIGAII